MTHHALMATLVLHQEGLTFHEVIQNIPTDPASVFVYLLLAGSGVLIWMGSRKKGKPST